MGRGRAPHPHPLYGAVAPRRGVGVSEFERDDALLRRLDDPRDPEATQVAALLKGRRVRVPAGTQFARCSLLESTALEEGDATPQAPQVEIEVEVIEATPAYLIGVELTDDAPVFPALVRWHDENGWFEVRASDVELLPED